MALARHGRRCGLAAGSTLVFGAFLELNGVVFACFVTILKVNRPMGHLGRSPAGQKCGP